MGSTGSVGQSVCHVLDRNKSGFKCKTLIFGRNIKTAYKQIRRLKPQYVGCLEKETAEKIEKDFSFVKEVFHGDGVLEAASIPCDISFSAVSGSDGCRFSAAALGNVRRLALANKETVVMGGAGFMELAERSGTEIIPVDSEHSAIHQCLRGEDPSQVRRLILTASGGAFRDMNARELEQVTPEMALAHPNWDMGSKITVDSATLVNKGLELMEAGFLFNMDLDKIDTMLHRESIIHSMVEFSDRSVMAQLSVPDMKLPVEYALNYPGRGEGAVDVLSLISQGTLTFSEIDHGLFPGIALARKAASGGDSARIAFNRVNEECVYAFLEKKIGFRDIYRYIGQYIDRYDGTVEKAADLAAVMEIDREISKQIKGELESL